MSIRARKHFPIFSLVFNSLLLLSCKIAFSQEEFYIPKALLIPVHTQSQQLHFSLGKGGGYDANLSYALTKHLALFTTGTLNKGANWRIGLWGDPYTIEKNDYAVKGGIGYFKVINHKLIKQIESYAGYGSYKVDNYWFFRDEKGKSGYKTKAKFWNVFWQIQATHKITRHELTGALRLAYSKYNQLEYQDVHYSYQHEKTTLNGLWGLSADPVVSYSYLVKKFKFNIQFGGSIALNSPITLDETYYLKEGNQTVAIKPPGIIKRSVGAPIGRFGVQYNFDFKRNIHAF